MIMGKQPLGAEKRAEIICLKRTLGIYHCYHIEFKLCLVIQFHKLLSAIAAAFLTTYAAGQCGSRRRRWQHSHGRRRYSTSPLGSAERLTCFACFTIGLLVTYKSNINHI